MKSLVSVAHLDTRRLEAGLPLDAVDTRRNAGVIANDL